jgi:hypothetical protein
MIEAKLNAQKNLMAVDDSSYSSNLPSHIMKQNTSKPEYEEDDVG